MGAEGNDITAPSLAVEDRLCHSAARRALPTKRIHSNAVPEGIWRGTSYYLVERSQRGEWHRGVVDFFGVKRESIACAINPA